ncbi:MAG: phospholipase A [Dechloromonas sp.]|uniref:phospholipase A n=1 Tax=Dechloromonas sp. TaxID=1917218 RepID=UPI0027EF7760|nr:phospholipase A [Dechloromonas sp.]MBT9519598.1 phospholipase A [Dechloromonas sp.]
MNKKKAILGLALLAGSAMAAEPLVGCADEADDRLRLACYDNAYKRLKTGSETVSDAQIDAQVATSDSQRDSSVMSKTWELGPADKRNTFVVRTYLPNFLLPVHYTSNLNRTPHSPTQAVGTANRDYRSVEAKLQISLRAKVVEDLLLPGADLWAAYTQRSLWQLWDSGDSSPFRSTDYQPEMIYVVPVPERFGKLPLGWDLRMLQLGFAHQSNGQSDPLSRSWNRITLGAGLEHGDFSLQIRDNQRIRVQGKDDNPDLVEYIGRTEFNMAWSPGTSTLGVTWRTGFKSLSRGSLQLDWTHPVFADQPAGLRWYVQLFHGYGETLLDYNHRQTSLGLGLTLFQF